MNKDAINIETIKQYLAGTLDAKAMHALEKQALDDPFFAEALDGLLQNPKASAEALSALQGKLKNKAGAKNKEKLRSFHQRTWLSVAAILLVFIGAGIFFINKNQPQKNITKEVVRNIMPAKVSPLDSTNKLAIVQPVQKAETAVEIKSSQQKAAAHLSDKKRAMANMDTLAVAFNQSSQEQREALPAVNINSKGLKDVPAANIVSLLQGRVAGLAIERKNSNNLGQKYYKARLVDSVTGEPVAHAIIHYNNGLKSTVSDSLGNFSLFDTVKNITVNAIGYVAVNKPVHKNAIIILPKKQAALNDVVVVGYKLIKKQSMTGVTIVSSGYVAEPVIGREAFDKYVQQTILAKYAIGDSGVVKVGFKVKRDGSLSGFKILKGVNRQRNKQAIELLKNGSKWIPNPNGKKTVAHYEVAFP